MPDPQSQSSFVWTTRIDAEHPALAGHFPGHPVVPGVVLIGEVLRAARALIDPRLELSGLPVVKFSAPVVPGDALSIVLEPAAGERIAFSIRRDGRDGPQTVASGALVCVRPVIL